LFPTSETLSLPPARSNGPAVTGPFNTASTIFIYPFRTPGAEKSVAKERTAMTYRFLGLLAATAIGLSVSAPTFAQAPGSTKGAQIDEADRTA
jgi:hypothetical protein